MVCATRVTASMCVGGGSDGAGGMVPQLGFCGTVVFACVSGRGVWGECCVGACAFVHMLVCTSLVGLARGADGTCLVLMRQYGRRLPTVGRDCA